MTRISKIDDFQKEFPYRYGLPQDGSCYDVNYSFMIQVLTSYKEIYGQSGIKYVEPVWENYTTKEGDTIISSKSGAYIIPLNSDGFIECRPIRNSGPQEPSFDVFDKNSISLVGKDLFRLHSMSFEERKKITTANGL
jgi:hypothetical protein